MSKTVRDAFTDPRAGDVFVRGKSIRAIIRRGPLGPSNNDGVEFPTDGHVRTWQCLSDFLKWAKKADKVYIHP